MKLKQNSVLNILKQIKAKNNNVIPIIFYQSFFKRIVVGSTTNFNYSGNTNANVGEFKFQIDKKLLTRFDMNFLLDINNYNDYTNDSIMYLKSKQKYML